MRGVLLRRRRRRQQLVAAPASRRGRREAVAREPRLPQRQRTCADLLRAPFRLIFAASEYAARRPREASGRSRRNMLCAVLAKNIRAVSARSAGRVGLRRVARRDERFFGRVRARGQRDQVGGRGPRALSRTTFARAPARLGDRGILAGPRERLEGLDAPRLLLERGGLRGDGARELEVLSFQTFRARGRRVAGGAGRGRRRSNRRSRGAPAELERAARLFELRRAGRDAAHQRQPRRALERRLQQPCQRRVAEGRLRDAFVAHLAQDVI
mmetsp:Transcript_12682/g.39179  ORF Transcript_12682/g.39179 Transcript_12682/m.39179 type:complete len:270 (+) Transcript_12682:2232-3041(+)